MAFIPRVSLAEEAFIPRVWAEEAFVPRVSLAEVASIPQVSLELLIGLQQTLV